MAINLQSYRRPRKNIALLRGLNSRTKIIVRIIPVVLMLLVFAPAMSFGISAFETSIGEILRNPDKFNQSQVIVQGRVTQVEQKETQHGAPYTFFYLLDPSSGEKIGVEYRRGILSLQESALVTVGGDYYRKPVRGTFEHTIRAIYVR